MYELAPEADDRLDVRKWAANVISWDGLLPLSLILVASVIKAAFQNQQQVVEFSLLLLAVIAFLFRLRVGLRQLSENHCNTVLRKMQLCVFMLCMFLWALLEFIMMLVPAAHWFGVPEDRVIWVSLISVYLMGMTFVWYPGRSR